MTDLTHLKSSMTPILELTDVEAAYGRVIALRKISLTVMPGEIVTIIGGNGAGKTTTLATVSGIVKPFAGDVKFMGESILNIPPQRLPLMGICQSPEGRRIFPRLTVEENLDMGAFFRSDVPQIKADMERVYEFFPVLKDRRKQRGGSLSGGEQQMLAIGRAVMACPKLLLLDEPSLGLAPLLVEEIFDIVAKINKNEGVSVLLVEQNARMALSLADYGYIMENGRIVMDGAGRDLLQNPDVQEFYLGLGHGGEKRSYHDVKHYRRRKRWLG